MKKTTRNPSKKSSSRIRKVDTTNPLTLNDGTVESVVWDLDRLINSYFGKRAVQKIVTYLRVSTARQGRSGLGLEAQQAAVDAFVTRRGCEVLATYTEVESGKKSDRPQLAKALRHAKRSKATLVVAKLDRLARNVAFLATLMESGCDFIAIDMEHANRLTLHILSAVAEGEGRAISERTKDALQVKKARGAKLGSASPKWQTPKNLAARARGLKLATVAAAKVHTAAAIEAYADLLPEMQQMRSDGKTFQQIADALNAEGHTTRRGKAWNNVQVLRVLNRAN